MTFYSNLVHFDPEGHTTYFSEALYFKTDERPAIEGSIYIHVTASMTTEAQRIKECTIEPFTGKAEMSLNYLRIRNTSAYISAITSANIDSYIIANASTEILGQALLTAQALRLTIPEGVYQITKDDYFTKNQPAKSESIANYIIVETQPLKPVDTPEEVYRANEPINIESGETQTVTVHYQEPPVPEAVASLEGNSFDTAITNVNYYSWGADVIVENSGASTDSYTIVINGKPLKVQGSERVIAKDDNSIIDNGKIEYKFPDNHLVQTKEMAQKIADKLLASFKDNKRDASIDWRGNPALILADIFNIPEYQKGDIDQRANFYITRQNIEYDGGLRATLEGRKV